MTSFSLGQMLSVCFEFLSVIKSVPSAISNQIRDQLPILGEILVCQFKWKFEAQNGKMGFFFETLRESIL